MGACFQCKRTGERICDQEEADIRCHICGFCERESVKEALNDTDDAS